MSRHSGQDASSPSCRTAEKTAKEAESYGAQADRFFTDIKRLLDRDEPDYRD